MELLLRNRASVNQAKFFRAPCRKNYALDQKMNGTFYDGHDELYHHTKFGEDRTTRPGCRFENVVFVCCFTRQAAGIFTHQPKINILPHSEKTINWIEKWFTPFRMDTTSSITVQSLGRSNNARRLQVRKYGVCMFVCFCQAPRPARCSFEGDIL